MQHVSDLNLWAHILVSLIPVVLPGCQFLHELLVLLSYISELVKLFFKNLKTFFDSFLTQFPFTLFPFFVTLLLHALSQFLNEMFFVLKFNEQLHNF